MGLAEELHEAAEQAIEAKEQAEDRAGTGQRLVAIGGDGKDDEQQDALQRRFIELARMARRVASAGKRHGPGHVAYSPNHLGIDEVGDASEEQAERRRRRGYIAEGQRVDALCA